MWLVRTARTTLTPPALLKSCRAYTSTTRTSTVTPKLSVSMPETSLGLDLASKKQRKRSDYPYQLDYRLRWADNDMFHHLNNPIYGVLIDSIINEYLITRVGYNTTDYPRTALVANTYCDYFGQLHYPGMLDIGLRVVKLGKNSVMYECGFFKRGEEAVKAVGGFVQIWVRRSDGKAPPEGLEGTVRTALENLMQPGLADKSKL